MTVEEPGGAVGQCSLLLVVSDHDDGTLLLTVQTHQDVHHVGCHLGVQVARRLVGKDNLRIAGNDEFIVQRYGWEKMDEKTEFNTEMGKYLIRNEYLCRQINRNLYGTL